jgi:hypothetical protein
MPLNLNVWARREQFHGPEFIIKYAGHRTRSARWSMVIQADDTHGSKQGQTFMTTAFASQLAGDFPFMGGLSHILDANAPLVG